MNEGCLLCHSSQRKIRYLRLLLVEEPKLKRSAKTRQVKYSKKTLRGIRNHANNGTLKNLNVWMCCPSAQNYVQSLRASIILSFLQLSSGHCKWFWTELNINTVLLLYCIFPMQKRSRLFVLSAIIFHSSPFVEPATSIWIITSLLANK